MGYVIAVALVSSVLYMALTYLVEHRKKPRLPTPPPPEVTPTVVVDDVVIGHGTYHLREDPEIVVDIIRVADGMVYFRSYAGNSEEEHLMKRLFLKLYERRFPPPPLSSM